MIKAVVKFWGPTRDAFGMPVPYLSYLVVASPWQSASDGVASVVPLSANSPMANQHYPVLQGGERAAFDAALTALKSLPGNTSLSFHSHEG